MKAIKFEGAWRYVLDETKEHYICEPKNANEGYHWITKSKVEEERAC
jgi:hypothetical protein